MFLLWVVTFVQLLNLAQNWLYLPQHGCNFLVYLIDLWLFLINFNLVVVKMLFYSTTYHQKVNIWSLVAYRILLIIDPEDNSFKLLNIITFLPLHCCCLALIILLALSCLNHTLFDSAMTNIETFIFNVNI